MSKIDRGNRLGCVLAGGLSRRMGGGDKALAQLGPAPLIVHVIDRLKDQVGAMIVNANGDPSHLADLHLPIVPDTIEGHPGPLAGILAGMRHAQALDPAFSHIITAAADTPFFPLDLANRLAEASQDPAAIVLAKSDDRVHPVCGLWPVCLADELESWLLATERRSVLAWTDSRAAVAVSFETFSIGEAYVDPFMNINTPEDLAAARNLLSRQR